MRLFFSRNKPKIKEDTIKKDGFSGWIKCDGCHEMIHSKELEKNFSCCTKCAYHYQISAKKRLELLVDADSFEEMFTNLQSNDPLGFIDSKKYKDRIKDAKKKSGNNEAVLVGVGKINSSKIAIGILDFLFMGGSMGSVVGEKITLLIEYAEKNNLPLVIVSASGGARMQESIFSLMQMAKTSAALSRLDSKGIPYISVLTNPTTGGVTASFASLGDIILAEPGALIAFAGPRVVEQTIGEKLPEGAQRSEFLLKKGMIDSIVQRADLKEKVSFFIDFLSENKKDVDKNSKNILKELLEAQK